MCRKTGAMGTVSHKGLGSGHVVDKHYATILCIKALLPCSHSQLNHPTHIVHISSTTGYEPGDLPEALLLPTIPSVHQSQTISSINLIAQITKNPSNKRALLNLLIRSKHYNSSRNRGRQSPMENRQRQAKTKSESRDPIPTNTRRCPSRLQAGITGTEVKWEPIIPN